MLPRHAHCEAKSDPDHQGFATALLHFPLSMTPEVIAELEVFVDQVSGRSTETGVGMGGRIKKGPPHMSVYV